MTKEKYEKAQTAYHQAAAAAKAGDRSAMADKAKLLQDCREIKREAARAGVILNVRTVRVAERGGKSEVQMKVEESRGDSRRSLQEEYCRRFSSNAPVILNGQKTTLKDFHAKRLLRAG